MKNKLLSALAVLSFLSFASCSSDDSDNFNDANGNSVKRYITNVNIVSHDDSSRNSSLTVNYDAEGKVSHASDGNETTLFSYENGGLTEITGSGSQLMMNDVMSTVHDAYEVGEVLDYDGSGNPVKLRLFERDYDGTIYATYVATISYDSKPNPYFHTLDAAGIIDILDEVELNFSMAPQSEDLVLAKKLLPVHNPVKVVVRDEETNEVTGEVTATYQYNSDNYPVSATVTEKDRNNYIYSYTTTYIYRQ